MSLLLNALKKVEEGDKPDEQKAAQDASQTPEAAQAAPQATQSASAAPGAPAAPGVALAAPAPAAAPAVAIDLDAVIDAPAEPAAEVSGKKRSLKDIETMKIFGAGASDEGGGLKKLIIGLVGVAVVGGGGYGLLVSGVVPGLNMSIFGGMSSDGGQVVASSSSASGGDEPFAGAGELELLPIPIVDVQSEVDFADLRLPENRPEIIGDDEYKRKIAIYTGYDIEAERQRIFEEAGILTSQQQEEDALIVPDIATGEELVIEEKELFVRTADASRSEKARLDALTSSENNLNIVINNGDSMKMEQAAEEVAEEVVVADTQVRQSEDGMKRNALVKQARRLYYDGKYLEAETIYRTVLRDVPANIDALRGLALVAVATGRYQLAAATYLNILDYYPNDPIAVAELTNLRADGGKGDFYETERILKRLLGKSSSADARLYFALGNLYASNGSWYKAQESYFEAYTRDANNPDYNYNLAVVFDYLNKPELAIRYYEQALVLSDGVLVGFDRGQVEKRIAELT